MNCFENPIMYTVDQNIIFFALVKLFDKTRQEIIYMTRAKTNTNMS